MSTRQQLFKINAFLSSSRYCLYVGAVLFLFLFLFLLVGIMSCFLFVQFLLVLVFFSLLCWKQGGSRRQEVFFVCSMSLMFLYNFCSSEHPDYRAEADRQGIFILLVWLFSCPFSYFILIMIIAIFYHYFDQVFIFYSNCSFDDDELILYYYY